MAQSSGTKQRSSSRYAFMPASVGRGSLPSQTAPIRPERPLACRFKFGGLRHLVDSRKERWMMDGDHAVLLALEYRPTAQPASTCVLNLTQMGRYLMSHS